MISELIRALKAGEELKNKENWKNAQIITGALTSVAGAALMGLRFVGVEVPITDDQIVAIAGGIAAVLGLFNTYTTAATSKSVGLQTGSNSNDAATVVDNPPTA